MILSRRWPRPSRFATFEWADITQTRAIYAEPPSDIIRDAEAVEWQLADEIRANETGFRGADGETFDTFEIAAIELGYEFAGPFSEAGVA